MRINAGPTRSSADYGGELAPVVLFVERAARDANGNLQLSGWVVSLGAVVAIQIYAGDERIGSPKLGLRRDDVAGVFPAYPNALHAGFTLSTVLSQTARDATTLRAQAICADGFAHEVVVPLGSWLPGSRRPPAATVPERDRRCNHHCCLRKNTHRSRRRRGMPHRHCRRRGIRAASLIIIAISHRYPWTAMSRWMDGRSARPGSPISRCGWTTSASGRPNSGCCARMSAANTGRTRWPGTRGSVS